MAPIADWIMKRATGGAPEERAALVEAMRGEYSELTRDKLSWAIGCWLAVTGWRLRADLGYFATLIVGAIVAPTLGELAVCWLFLVAKPWLPPISGYIVCMVPALVLCFALGLYRPNRLATTVLLSRAIGMVITLEVFAWMGSSFHSPLDVILRLKIMDLPFVVGYPIWIASDLMAAWLGGRLRQTLAYR